MAEQVVELASRRPVPLSPPEVVELAEAVRLVRAHGPDAGLGYTDPQRACIAANLYLRRLFASSEGAADQLHVSRAAERRARTTLEHAHPCVVAHVWNGSLPVNTAARIAGLPGDQQVEMMRRFDEGTSLAVLTPPTKSRASSDGRGANVRRLADPQAVTLARMADQLRVIAEHGFDQIAELDDSVDQAAAAALATKLAGVGRSLNRTLKLLKKRAQS